MSAQTKREKCPHCGADLTRLWVAWQSTPICRNCTKRVPEKPQEVQRG